ncbi:co-chaperone GroES [bacterium]|nr:co-chaperone GroES [bacterium]
MNIKPLSDRLVVKPSSAEDKVQGGIIIPDTAKEKPQRGEVVAVGPGKVADSGKAIPLSVKKGDTVLYGKYSGTEITIDNEEYLIVRESDILAIV